MSIKWDFRLILNVYPDKSGFTCVGTTKKRTRCGQKMIASSDKARAARLLNEMGTLSKLSSSYKYLEELAELTLCPRWHRDKPGNCQIHEVCMRWRSEIAAFEAEAEREKERAALIKSERTLAKLRKDIDYIKVKLEKEEEKISDKVFVSNSLPMNVKVEKPLPASMRKVEAIVPVISAAPISKPSLADFTPPPSLENTPSRSIAQDSAEKSTSDDASTSKLQSHNYSLPSPPESPIESQPLHSCEIKQERLPPSTPTRSSHEASPQRQDFTITKTSSIKITSMSESSDTAPKAMSQEKTNVETFSFEFPPTPDTTPQPQSKDDPIGTADAPNIAYKVGAGNQVPLPVFDVGVAEELSSSLPSYSASTNSMKAMSAFNFNTQYNIPSKSFEFATPTKLSFAMRLPEKPSTVWDDFNTRAEKRFRRNYGGDDESEASYGLQRNWQQSNSQPRRPIPTLAITPPSFGPDPFLSTYPQRPQDSPKPPLRKSSLRARFGLITPESTPEPPQIKTHDTKDSYGYALVTPTTSTKYKTYLPAAQQHSTMTPPATPETRKEGFQDPFWAFTSTPSPQIAILRKPLPNPPTSPLAEIQNEEAEICGACGVGEDGCACHKQQDSGVEDERGGCFHSLRLRRLRKVVVRKINAVTARVMHRETDASTTE